MLRTILHRHIPHKKEVDDLLKNFSTKVLHSYNLPIHEILLAEEYQHSPMFKDIYLYITRNQFSISATAQMLMKSNLFITWLSMDFGLEPMQKKTQ